MAKAVLTWTFCFLPYFCVADQAFKAFDPATAYLRLYAAGALDSEAAEHMEFGGWWHLRWLRKAELDASEDMDCGSIRSSVVDWALLQRAAATFDKKWVRNMPPQPDGITTGANI